MGEKFFYWGEIKGRLFERKVLKIKGSLFKSKI